MTAVQVYVSRMPPGRFLTLAHEEGLIVLQASGASMPREGLCVARDKECACRDTLVVRQRTIIVPRGTHFVNEYPYYQIPAAATDEEELTLVTWLTRHRFSSFGCKVTKSKMERFLSPNAIFQTRNHPTCVRCEQHCMIREPVFCLKSIVLSAKNKGPTIQSVLT